MTYEIRMRGLIDKAIDGILLYGSDKLAGFINLQLYGTTVKNLKQYADAVMKLALGLAIDMIPQLQISGYVTRFGDVSFKKGVSDILTQFIDKPAFVFAEEANKLHVYNLDATTVEVFIDGSKLANDAFTVSGTAEDMTITLKTALGSGEHDVMVVGLKKSAVGKVKV